MARWDRASPGSAAVAEPAEPSIDRLRADGWILPWGLEGPDRRRWTMIGPVDAPTATIVDPRGLVTPCSHRHGCSLDWWVGADDRWHLPSREASVRQRLVDDAPVVETTMRIPGGDAVHRAFATRGPGSGPGAACDHWVVVEVENRSRVPFALALVVRPFTPEWVTDVTGVDLDPLAGGPTYLVQTNGEADLLLARRPARVAVSDLAHGDVAATVLAGEAGDIWPEEPPVNVPLVTAAFVVPVPHTATVRVVLPRGVWPPERAEELRWPERLPSAEAVARGWAQMTRRGARFEVPDERLAALVAANRRHLLATFGVDDLGPTVRPGTGWEPAPTDPADAATLLGAADRAGFGDEVGRVLATWPARFSGLWHGHRRAHVPGTAKGRAAATGAVLAAMGDHGRLSPGPSFDAVLPELAAAVATVDGAARRRRLAGDPHARHWCQLGCTLAADALVAAGQPEAAAQVRAVAERVGDIDDPWPVPDLAAPIVDVRAVAAAARRLVATSDALAADLLAWLVRAASPTATWPREVDGATLAGVGGGPGHDAVAGAMVLDVVRDLLVRETAGGLALLSVLPAGWYGQGVEVHDAPTASGRCSYALRWHGQRPALLWDVVAPADAGPVVLTAPGLDPAWRTSEPRGEALLASAPAPGAPPGASFT